MAVATTTKPASGTATATKPGQKAPPPPPKQAKKRQKVPGAKKIIAKDLPAFTRQLSAMLSSGLPVVQTLDALQEQTVNKAFKTVSRGAGQIEAAHRLGGVLSSRMFLTNCTSHDEAGETGGLLRRPQPDRVLSESTARSSAGQVGDDVSVHCHDDRDWTGLR
jgi:hypothetical protein